MARLSSAQFAEWIAYFNIEPPEDHRSDSLMGQLLSMTGNINRAEKAAPFMPADFMPWVEIPDAEASEPVPLDVQTQTAQLKALFKGK